MAWFVSRRQARCASRNCCAGRATERPGRLRSPRPKAASGEDFPGSARGDREVARQMVEGPNRAGGVEGARGAQGERQTPEIRKGILDAGPADGHYELRWRG